MIPIAVEIPHYNQTVLQKINGQTRAETAINASPKLAKSHRQSLIEYMSQQSSALTQTCQSAPASKACTDGIDYLLWFLSKNRLRQQLPNSLQHELAYSVLSVLYNGNNAQALFASRLPNINSRANFFAVNDVYYRQSTIPVRWFGVANQVSRECLTGLGARQCASYLTFGSTKILGNPDIYGWRQVAGETVLINSFDNFKALFNGQFHDAVQWDIAQLNNEQKSLQTFHERFLANYPIFTKAYKTVMHLRIKQGVDILRLSSRIRYGCYRMQYTQAQGCVW